MRVTEIFGPASIQNGEVPSVELWNDKNVVAIRNGYRIAVDDPHDAKYVTAWSAENKRVATLSTRRTTGEVGRDYLSISSVDVDLKHRKKGIGLALYRALLSHMSSHWKGISTYLPDQANKRQVPAIWRRLGCHPHPASSDYLVVERTPT